MSLDFFIIGAQKAATSTLQAALREVDGIYMPLGESAFFEDPDHASAPWRDFAKGRPSNEVCGIKRPDALCRSDVIGRVAAACPELRLIAVLRDPIARAVSAYYHLARHARIPARGLDESVVQGIEDWRAGTPTPESTLVTYGLYGHFLQEWRQYFSAEQILLLSQSTVVMKPQETLAVCCEHLGVLKPDRLPDVAPERNVGVYDPRFLKVHAWGHGLKTRQVAGTDRRLPSRSVARRLIGSAVTRSADLLSQTSMRPASLRPPTRAKLEEIFSGDLALLREVAPDAAIDWSLER